MVANFVAGPDENAEAIWQQSVHADVHRYPGSGQRIVVGTAHDVDIAALGVAGAAASAATGVVGVCELVGDVLAGEPWLDRVPALVTAAITRREDDWVLTDHQGSLPIATESMRSDAVATLLAASGGRPVTVALEWTPRGVVPLTVFLDDRSIDIGPRADPSFVSAA